MEGIDSLDLLFPKILECTEFELLCAIEFQARGGKELDSVIIYAPNK
jgi:hypothetical protein